MSPHDADRFSRHFDRAKRHSIPALSKAAVKATRETFHAIQSNDTNALCDALARFAGTVFAEGVDVGMRAQKAMERERLQARDGVETIQPELRALTTPKGAV